MFTFLRPLCAFAGVAVLTLIAVPSGFAQEEAATEPAEGADAAPESLTERASYVIGLNLGTNLKQDQIEIDVPSLIEGLSDALTGEEVQMSEEEIQQTLQQFQQQMVAQQQQRAEEMAEKSQQFLADVRERDGVQATESGLLYEVLEEGEGESPTAQDIVRVHYRGTLMDGTEFDSSYERGEPAEFPVRGVIPGWTEALQMMKPGGKWKIYLPPDLAYGAQGAPGGQIPPNAALTFEVELLEVVDQPAGAQGQPQARPQGAQPQEGAN